MSMDFNSRRTTVMSRRGMVATSHPLAAQAGLNILQSGGNAADAAVAAAAVLAVVEAAATGIGGDAFALYWDASKAKVEGLNGSGRSGQRVTGYYARSLGFQKMPERHGISVTIPGAVRAWSDLLDRYGRLGLKQVLAPAIYYAHDGFPVSPTYARVWARLAPVIETSPHASEYLPNGRAPVAGQVVRLHALGRTLQAIANEGADVFYQDRRFVVPMVRSVNEAGGRLTADDFLDHRSEWVKPIQTSYRGHEVWEIPPNGQGLITLEALNILEGFTIDKYEWDDPYRLHLMIESMRLAFADAEHYIGDPEKVQIPVEGLLRKSYARSRRMRIIPERALQPVTFGRPRRHSDTVYLAVVDNEGNACSFINSLYMGFGSGIIAEDTGIIMQNRGANFSLEDGHANSLSPGKRPYHTIIPGMVTHKSDLWAVFGVMGGFMQPQGHLQVLTAMIDDGLDPQAALDRLRWIVMHENGQIGLEDGIKTKTMAELARMGHQVRPITGDERAMFGSGQIIRTNPPTRLLMGGTDPRKDGHVAAY